jgi:hypothetical protein
MCFDSELEVEAAKGEPYHWPMLRAFQLFSEVYTSCRGGGLSCIMAFTVCDGKGVAGLENHK